MLAGVAKITMQRAVMAFDGTISQHHLMEQRKGDANIKC